MFSENDILNCIKQISEICMSNTFDSKFQKYSYFFYPEKLSIFVFYLIKNKNISFPKILDIIIQSFHLDYVNNTINFNQNKYLMETRCSGMLTKPYSAMAVELVVEIECGFFAEHVNTGFIALGNCCTADNCLERFFILHAQVRHEAAPGIIAFTLKLLHLNPLGLQISEKLRARHRNSR